MALLSRRNGRRLLAVAALAACAAAVPATVAVPWEDAVTAGSLGHSLRSVTGATLAPACRAAPRGAWVCALPDAASRTIVDYRVHARGRCWTARRKGPPVVGLPAAARGCVGMLDQLRLNDRF
jgi:hypothetical protein